jgi:hypothetical protein
MRRLSTFFLAGALLLTAACGGGDKKGESSDGGSRKLFQPAGVVGPDSFAPTFSAATYKVDPSTLTSGSVSGSAPGLYAGRTYGGSGQNICDVEAMIKFLKYYEDRGRAWADVQGIEFENLETYLRSLTPVFALQNLNVKMFGFKNGKSYGYDAVIAAGTAILIDDQGMPRARCACGNPLLGSSETPPDGTDNPPDDEGNPEPQDSVPPEDETVPGDTTVPGDNTVPPVERQPDPDCPKEFEGNTYTDSGGTTWTWVKGNPTPETSPGGANWWDEDSNSYRTTQELEPEFIDCPEPDDQRIPQDDPDCPDWNSPPVTYTDPNGDIWIFDPQSGTWYSTTDFDQFKVSTEDLPGYSENCDEDDTDIPENPCPVRRLDGKYVPGYYIDANGNRWEWASDVDEWFQVDTTTSGQLEDIPGYLEECGLPRQLKPECPQQYVHEESNSLSWTAYVTRGGEVWLFDPFARNWTNQQTGEVIPGDDPSALPGYLKDCPSPNDGQGNPCPPIRPDIRETWTDPATGETWAYRIGVRDGRLALLWVNDTTGERLDRSELYAQACPDGTTPGETPECPPGKPILGQVWIDTLGNEWVYAANTGGADGWDNVSTEWIENLRTQDLPNQPDDCLPPVEERPCPPILKIADGTTWFGDNGHTYVYKAAAGGWVDATDPEGSVVPYTVLLPGYSDDCMPPCPPLDATRSGYFGVWIDPSNGTVWIKPIGGTQWYRIPDGETIDDTRDLPFYTEDCLPPCDPESDGGSTYEYDENDKPVAPEQDPYSDDKDKAVDVKPGDEPAKVTQIVDELVEPSTAVGDDCNPEGCLTADTEPELGHSFKDSGGVVWRYVGDGNWLAEDGRTATDVLDIPGYAEACLPPDVPLERECPEEYEGARYVDSNGIEWVWVGFSPDPADSDHGQHWFHRYEDGTAVYKYTVELDPFLSDCPKPPDLVIQEGSIRVDLRAPKILCVGESTEIVLVASPSEDQFITTAEINIDGAGDYGNQVERTVWVHTWTPDAPGYYEIKGSAEDSAGLSGADLVVVVVEECGDSTEQSNPLPIDVRINAETSVCVGDKFVFQVIVTLDPRANLTSLDVTADGAPTRVGQQSPTTYSGSLLAASEGELEIQAKGEDDLGTTDTAVHYVKVIPCDDTPNDSTPEQETPSRDNTPPVVTVTATPECIEIETDAQKTYSVVIEASDADGDTMTVNLNNGLFEESTVTGTGSVSKIFIASERNRGTTLTFTATADDGQATTTSNTASVRVEYPGGCSPTESTKPNTMPSVTIVSQPTKSVAVCKSGQTTSEKVSFTITANDAEGDKLTVTLASYDKTISLGTAAKSLGTLTGSGSLSTTETVTASQIGHTIEYTARADDGIFTGISKVSIVVVEKTTGCADNVAPTVNLANKTWPACLGQKGSPVGFTVGDTPGSSLTITIKVGKEVVQSGKKTIGLTGKETISYTFTPQMAGASVSVEVVDEKGLAGQPVTTTLTKEICPG